MDTRRARLKELASRSSRLWGLMPVPEALAGETRVETRNTLYRFRDGICYSVRRSGGESPRDPSAFLGMRLVGWMGRDEATASLTAQWQPGAYAVLWKPGAGPGGRSAVALTSPTIACRQVAAVRSEPAASGTVRRSTPPPLPPTIQRAVPVRPPTPPSFAPLAPPSTTRLHPGSVVPAPPETPTPPRRSSVPPPLPTRAHAGLAARPFRTPAILS